MVIGRRVLHNGIELGRIVGEIVDAEGATLGYEVRCGDERIRFLPAPALGLSGDDVTLRSPLTLLDSDEADFYRRARG